MPPMRCRILIPITSIFIAAFLFWSFDRYDHAVIPQVNCPLDRVAPTNLSHPQKGIPNKTPDELCRTDESMLPAVPLGEWLIRKNYTRIYMRSNFHPADTKFGSMEEIEGKVLPPFRPLDRGLRVVNKNESWPCPPIVDVHVAMDLSIDNTNDLLFGLATTVERLDSLLPALLYSYGNTKATLLVLVPDNRNDLDQWESYFRNRGLDLRLRPSPLEFNGRYFGLLKAFKKFINEERHHTKWVTFVDDDTFFPSLARIANRLAALDSSHRHYIGAASESKGYAAKFGGMAFGGAGVFVSKGLLEFLQPAYQKCQNVGEMYGDEKLALCIAKYGKAKLTVWDTLYQMDMREAPDGMFESGREFDSLHHWNTWYKKDVTKMSTVAVAGGRNSVLRRWRFDHTVKPDEAGVEKRSFWVLTNGYSLVRYTMDAGTPASAVNFNLIEKTWEGVTKEYEKNLGRMRPKDQPGITKDRWLLSDAVVIGHNVHQTYIRKGMDGHSVIELIWLGDKGWLDPNKAYHH